MRCDNLFKATQRFRDLANHRFVVWVDVGLHQAEGNGGDAVVTQPFERLFDRTEVWLLHRLHHFSGNPCVFLVLLTVACRRELFVHDAFVDGNDLFVEHGRLLAVQVKDNGTGLIANLQDIGKAFGNEKGHSRPVSF